MFVRFVKAILGIMRPSHDPTANQMIDKRGLRDSFYRFVKNLFLHPSICHAPHMIHVKAKITPRSSRVSTHRCLFRLVHFCQIYPSASRSMNFKSHFFLCTERIHHDVWKWNFRYFDIAKRKENINIGNKESHTACVTPVLYKNS